MKTIKNKEALTGYRPDPCIFLKPFPRQETDLNLGYSTLPLSEVHFQHLTAVGLNTQLQGQRLVSIIIMLVHCITTRRTSQ